MKSEKIKVKNWKRRETPGKGKSWMASPETHRGAWYCGKPVWWSWG